jgi:serine/threonine protein kinase
MRIGDWALEGITGAGIMRNWERNRDTALHDSNLIDPNWPVLEDVGAEDEYLFDDQAVVLENERHTDPKGWERTDTLRQGGPALQAHLKYLFVRMLYTRAPSMNDPLEGAPDYYTSANYLYVGFDEEQLAQDVWRPPSFPPAQPSSKLCMLCVLVQIFGQRLVIKTQLFGPERRESLDRIVRISTLIQRLHREKSIARMRQIVRVTKPIVGPYPPAYIDGVRFYTDFYEFGDLTSIFKAFAEDQQRRGAAEQGLESDEGYVISNAKPSPEWCFVTDRLPACRQIPEPFIWLVFKSIAEGLWAMQTGHRFIVQRETGLPRPKRRDWKAIFHQDLKPANKFLGTAQDPYFMYPQPVLGDFDLAIAEDGPEIEIKCAGTPGWQAPVRLPWWCTTCL